MLRRGGQSDSQHPLVHRHDRLRRHLLRRGGNRPWCDEGLWPGASDGVAPDDWSVSLLTSLTNSQQTHEILGKPILTQA